MASETLARLPIRKLSWAITHKQRDEPPQWQHSIGFNNYIVIENIAKQAGALWSSVFKVFNLVKDGVAWTIPVEELCRQSLLIHQNCQRQGILSWTSLTITATAKSPRLALRYLRSETEVVRVQFLFQTDQDFETVRGVLETLGCQLQQGQPRKTEADQIRVEPERWQERPAVNGNIPQGIVRPVTALPAIQCPPVPQQQPLPGLEMLSAHASQANSARYFWGDTINVPKQTQAIPPGAFSPAHILPNVPPMLPQPDPSACPTYHHQFAMPAPVANVRPVSAPTPVGTEMSPPPPRPLPFEQTRRKRKSTPVADAANGAILVSATPLSREKEIAAVKDKEAGGKERRKAPGKSPPSTAKRATRTSSRLARSKSAASKARSVLAEKEVNEEASATKAPADHDDKWLRDYASKSQAERDVAVDELLTQYLQDDDFKTLCIDVYGSCRRLDFEM